MKIAFFSDTHGMHKSWNRKFPLPEADVLVFAGDLSRRGEVWEIKDFLDWYGSLDYEYKLFIAGNHDFGFENGIINNIPNLIPEGIKYLENEGITIDGVNFWGSPITPEFNSWAFNKQRGSEIMAYWNLIPKNTDILITHGPPANILDYVPMSNYHAGCQDLAIAIDSIKPKVHAFGHIHEGAGVETHNNITYINASAVNVQYQIAHEARLIEI